MTERADGAAAYYGAVTGLPGDLSATAVMALATGGEKLVLADDGVATVFDLVRRNDTLHASATTRYELEGEIVAIKETPDGPVATTVIDGDTPRVLLLSGLRVAHRSDPDDQGDSTPEGHPAPGLTVPAPDGGSYIGYGNQVERRPPDGSGRNPCGRTLAEPIGSLRRVGGHLLATDRSGRTATLLSADLNLLDEWTFPRGGARLIVAPDSPLLLVGRNGEWTWTDVDGLVAHRRADLDPAWLPDVETKVFIGQSTHVMSYGQPTNPTRIKALILPVIEGGQAYTSPNLAGFNAYVQRAVAPVLKSYYTENSFGRLTDVSVDVFSANVGPADTPLVLPRPRIADYFWPTYDPARIDLTRPGLTGAETTEFDGRENLVLQAKPMDNAGPARSLSIKFFALGFRRDQDLYPVDIRFIGNEWTRLDMVLPAGTTTSLTLRFPAKTITIADDTQVAAAATELATYLDGVLAAAETAGGLTSRLFATPQVRRIAATGIQFGSLVVTVAHAASAGPKLKVTKVTASVPGGDPIGLGAALPGVLPVTDTGRLERYLDIATLLAQDEAGANYTARLLRRPKGSYTSGKLVTSFTIADRFGGPKASVTLTSSSSLDSLFTQSATIPNSETTNNDAKALRDRSTLYQDAFSAATQRVRDAGGNLAVFRDYTVLMIVPIEPGVVNPSDPSAILASEGWAVTPLQRPFDFRGAENITTVVDKADPNVQIQAAWSLTFMDGGKIDAPMMVHEVGHALGYDDLYHQDGYRDELAYLDRWAMMAWHPPMSHHCGYHKLQSRWIDEGSGTETDFGRVLPLGPPDPAVTRTWDFLLVPIELWRDSLTASARAAFGAGADMPVVQLGYIDLGGDGATFGLIEARQRGKLFSHNLPGHGVLLTNCISWTLDDRFATNNFYRRPVQWLNPYNVLQNAGDTFDLALAPELPVKGMTVTVVDTKLVEGDAQVYHVQVTRQNADFVDLYFESPPIYYKNSDLWVDWRANNQPSPTDLVPSFPLGQPTDQGEAIRVPAGGTEPHWVVARLRNRGQVKAVDVKLNAYYFEPPGGGDGHKPLDVNNLSAYHLVGSVTHPEVPGGDTPELVLVPWDVPAGFGGHTCLLVQIEDYRIPEDSAGAALGSDDTWIANNHAQKNVDKYEALKASPFAPLEFEFSVRNEGPTPETAYLEPDALPPGMTLTISPPQQQIPAHSTVRFSCLLELDDTVIGADCEHDQRFRLHAWRQDSESSARWGGVEYEVRPRQRTRISLDASWDYDHLVHLSGRVVPDPGGGTVLLRLEHENQPTAWISVSVGLFGRYSWRGSAPVNSWKADAEAHFEGNQSFGTAKSLPVHIDRPPEY